MAYRKKTRARRSGYSGSSRRSGYSGRRAPVRAGASRRGGLSRQRIEIVHVFPGGHAGRYQPGVPGTLGVAAVPPAAKGRRF